MATKSTGWSCKVKASITDETKTSVKIKASAVWVNSGWRYNMSPIYAYVTINGKEYEVYSGDTKGKIETDNNSETTLGSKTITINKTHSSQTIKCSAKLVSKSTYVSGTKKSGSKSISVKPKTHYTYYYENNGGSGGPSSQKKWHGEAINLSKTVPTLTGYKFDFWLDTESGTHFKPGQLRERNADTWHIAMWKPNTYTISYSANGGSGAPGSQTKEYLNDITLSNAIPSRLGYAFQGWATSSGGSVAYYPGATFKRDANTTLYAVWKPYTYTISYNANGGSGIPGNQIKTYDRSLTLSTIKPSRTGYTFLGWSMSANASTASYSPGGSFNTNVTSNTTLYAVWRINTYTISYNANGGSGTMDKQVGNYNSSVRLSDNRFSRTNYAFQGWATSSGGSVAYYPGSSITLTKNITLYAVWKLIYANPTLDNYSVKRCDSAGVLSEIGQYLKLSFNWSVFDENYKDPEITTYYMIQGSTEGWQILDSRNLTGTKGTADLVIGGSVSVDHSYRIYSVLKDSKPVSVSSGTTTIESIAFPIDVKCGRNRYWIW